MLGRGVMPPRLTLLVLALLCLPLPALAAGDAPFPAVDPPGQWRIITRSDATSSSRCLGRPATPLCAVETLLACFLRGRFELCRQVDHGAQEYAEIFTAPSDLSKYLAYRVVSAGPGQDGEVRIDVAQREMLGDQKIGGDNDAPVSTFVLRRLPDGSWTITSWDQPEQ